MGKKENCKCRIPLQLQLSSEISLCSGCAPLLSFNKTFRVCNVLSFGQMLDIQRCFDFCWRHVRKSEISCSYWGVTVHEQLPPLSLVDGSVYI